MKKQLFTIILLLACCVNFSHAQKFTNYLTANGQPLNNVTSLAVDAQNVKWFGTLNGVARFDGTSWTLFTTADSLVANATTCIAVDHGGNIWAGTDEGVSMYNGTKWVKYTTANGLANNMVNYIAAETNAVWLASGSSVTKFDGTQFSTLAFPDSLASDYINSIAIDSRGNKWLGASIAGLLKYDNSVFSKFSTNDSLIDNDVIAIAIDAKDNKWIGTNSGISEFDSLDHWKANYRQKDGLYNNFVKSLTIDSKNNLWAGIFDGYQHDGGITKFTGTAWTSYVLADTLAGLQINNVRIDKNDHLWIATGNGVSEFVDKTEGISTVQKSPTIFPNPAKNYVMLNNLGNASQIRISDITGKVRISVWSNGPSVKLDVESLNSGIYILQVTDGNSIFSRKLIIN